MDGPILTQAKQLKAELTPKLKAKKLDAPELWHQVDLGFHATVEVCVPASVTVTYAEVKKYDRLFREEKDAGGPLYVPVTKKETWELAEQFKVFPLTTKVLDSTYKDPKVKTVPHHGGKFSAGQESDNFVEYAKYLASYGAHPQKLFSGAIKLWILSNVRSVKSDKCHPPNYALEDPSVNYGMYDPIAPRGRWQGAASCHDQNHFDYSQILQLMRNFKIYGRDFDVGTALLTAHPGIWDEALPYALTKSDQKYLPFLSPPGTNPRNTTDFLAGPWTVKYAGSGEETYVFKGNQVTWSNKQGGSGTGFWIEKNRQVHISWRKTGSTEVWPLGTTTTLATTLNFGVRGEANKIK